MARYSKQTYEMVARLIHSYTDNRLSYPDMKELARDFAEEFEKDNTKFDIIRFVKACGVTK